MSEPIYAAKPWLKSEEITLPEYLDRSGKELAERPALLFQGAVVSFKQLKEIVDRFAACLHAFGVKKGNAVAILLRRQGAP